MTTVVKKYLFSLWSYAAIVLLGGGVCFVSSPVAADAATLYESMKRAKTLYDQEKYDEALQAYTDAQIDSPEDAKLKFNIASTHYRMGNYEEAVKGFMDVAATAQDALLEEQSLYNIGNALYRQGKLEDSVAYYRKALELDPEDQDAKKNLEFVLEEIKRRMNEAKKTAQQQKQQQNQEQQQEQQQSDGQQQQQQGSDEQQRQNAQKGDEQEEQQGGDEQQQAQAAQDKKNSGEEEGEQQGRPVQAREMSKDEADQWLNSLEEKRDTPKQKVQKPGGRGYRSAKDW